mgnify:CR=1 FL=1
MQNYSKVFSFNKKKYIKNLEQGFNLVELMLGILITIFVAAAIMNGVSQAKSSLRSLQLKELAFNHIQGLTEKMKGRVSAGRLPSPTSKCEEECLEYNQDDECIIFAKEVCYDISRINTGGSIARRFKIDTRIEWVDNFGIDQELEFKTIQLVMNKAF